MWRNVLLLLSQPHINPILCPQCCYHSLQQLEYWARIHRSIMLFVRMSAADLHQQRSRTARTSPYLHLSDCFSQVKSEAYRICLCATAKLKQPVHHSEHGEVRPTTSRGQALARGNTGQIYGNGLIGWSCGVLARSRGWE